jgi:hypothetical protein
MSQEISGGASLSINSLGGNGSGTVAFVADISANGFVCDERVVPTTAGTIPMGGVTAPQAVFIKNLDDTNYMEVDSVSTMDKFPQKLYPGDGILLKPETGTIYWKANTATLLALIVAA